MSKFKEWWRSHNSLKDLIKAFTGKEVEPDWEPDVEHINKLVDDLLPSPLDGIVMAGISLLAVRFRHEKEEFRARVKEWVYRTLPSGLEDMVWAKLDEVL